MHAESVAEPSERAKRLCFAHGVAACAGGEQHPPPDSRRRSASGVQERAADRRFHLIWTSSGWGCRRHTEQAGDPDEAELKKPFERALIRNLRMLNRHLWELRGEVSMVAEQIVAERVAREKGQG